MNGMSTHLHTICVVFQWNIISIVILTEISITQVYCKCIVMTAADHL